MRPLADAHGLPLVVSRRFAASPERVFDAWFDADAAGAWLFATPGGMSKHVEIDASVGGGFAIYEQRDEGLATHFGAYLEIVRPDRIAFTFGTDRHGPSTVVTVNIQPDGDGGSLLTLTHRLDPDWASDAGITGRMEEHPRRTGAGDGRTWRRPYADHPPHL